MFFLNLTAGEFFLLFGAAAALLTALYMLSRSKQKRVVSTLRFWQTAENAFRQHQRRRMREPWSFLLQVLSVLLLLLAVAQLEWGSRQRAGRKYVLLLDTSAWSGERVKQGTLLDAEKEMEQRYLNTLAPQDRVMVVGVDALATPLTLFTSSRVELSKALEQLRPSYSALDLQQALIYAQRIQTLSGDAEGEIVYIGPGEMANSALSSSAVPANLRVLRVKVDRENCGIRRVDLRRDEKVAGAWNATVVVKNYGSRARVLGIAIRLRGRALVSRQLAVPGGAERMLTYSFPDERGGLLTVELQPGDALALDDRVSLHLPAGGKPKLAVFTRRPQVLKPLIEADHQLRAVFYAPEQYRPSVDADIALFDEMSPQEPPRIPSLWIEPPQQSAPVPVRAVTGGERIRDWNFKTALGAGLRERETRVKAAEVFQTSAHDIVIASVGKGPVVVASPQTQDHPKLAVVGFDPWQDASRFQATIPLLFAHLFRWLAPGEEQTAEVSASVAGEITASLKANEQLGTLQVQDEQGRRIPFSVHDRLLTFFINQPAQITVQSGDTVRRIAPVLADVAASEWTLPAQVKTGWPRTAVLPGEALDLWKWLALAGGLGVLIEWLLFGGKRRGAVRRSQPVNNQRVDEPKRELVSR